MNRKIATLIIAFGMMLSGFMATNAPAVEVITQTETVVINKVTVGVVKTADNFIILFDTSSSMDKPYQNTNMRRIDAAKEILKERNKNFPDLTYNAALYTFTQKRVYLKSPLKAYYPMKRYNKEEFAKALDQLPTKTSGPTPVQDALLSIEPVLKGLSGRTVVFLFSDGGYTTMGMGSNRKPVEIARGLSKKYDVCFVVISTAEGYQEKKLLKAVASVNECSRVIPFDALVGKPEYFAGALFVMDVKIIRLLATREKVVGFKIEKEKVVKAPETRKKVVGFKMDNILFDFNESNIRPEFYDELNTLGKFLQDNPDAYVVLAGFTDSTGPQEYNLGLSRRRAESVGIYLLKNFHIDDQRIVLHWYGEAAPVAGNETAESRSENRRVASIVGGL